MGIFFIPQTTDINWGKVALLNLKVAYVTVKSLHVKKLPSIRWEGAGGAEREQNTFSFNRWNR